MTENFRNSFLKINSMQNQCLVSHILLALLFQVWLFGSKTNFFFFYPKMPCFFLFFVFFFLSPPCPCFQYWKLGWVLGVACLERVKTTVAVLWPRWPGAARCPRPCHPPRRAAGSGARSWSRCRGHRAAAAALLPREGPAQRGNQRPPALSGLGSRGESSSGAVLDPE